MATGGSTRRRRVLDTSSQVQRILRQRPDTRLRARMILASVHADDRRALLACLARTRRDGGLAECNVRLTVRDVLRPVRLVARADDRDGIFAGWFGVIEDISHNVPAGLAVVARGAAEGSGDAWRPEHLSDSRGLNILLADDDPAEQWVIAAILGRMGHAVTIVETGRQAVAAATLDRFDVILMDMQMPEMDGLAATRAIRASAGRCADTIIIALTDDASPERKRFTDGAGFSQVLAKPVDRAALAGRLDAIAASLGRSAETTIAAAPDASLVEAERIEELRKVLGQSSASKRCSGC